MRSSYSETDVILLLKDLTGRILPTSTNKRELLIQQGHHYSEMLPMEYRPSEQYLECYRAALNQYAKPTALAVSILAQKIYENKGKDVALVSLARAGIPIGILLKRYIRQRYGVGVMHYGISIIRDKGIDKKAMADILSRHCPEDIQFVDGWIGKGTIQKQLQMAMRDYPGVSSELAVLSDPRGCSLFSGTHDDILIPSACLNATVTGLISRTILNPELIQPDDFHGAVYYEELEEDDMSLDFIEAIEKEFNYSDIITSIAEAYNVSDVNFIKPGIGETTRVLLRRVPWKILVNHLYVGSDELEHIRLLAKERDVPYEISKVDLGMYKVCGIIKGFYDL